MFDLKTAKISDFEIIPAKLKDIPVKVFIPFCRVKPGQEIFKKRAYEVKDMPEELYAQFKNH